MNTRQLLYTALLVPFLALTAFVLATDGLVGFYRTAFATPATWLLSLDLVLALGLALAWMYGDSRASGTPFLPYLGMTLAIGIAGPLGYLLHREARLRSRGRATDRTERSAELDRAGSPIGDGGAVSR